MWGESAGKIWGAFAGIFGPDRVNNRCEAGAKSQKIMAMVGDSGAERPNLSGDVPPVFLPKCICDFICLKPYSPPTEPAYFDWIKRFIHFHGKRHSPEVEAYLRHLNRIFIGRSWPTSINLCPQWSAMRCVRSWLISGMRCLPEQQRRYVQSVARFRGGARTWSNGGCRRQPLRVAWTTACRSPRQHKPSPSTGPLRRHA